MKRVALALAVVLLLCVAAITAFVVTRPRAPDLGGAATVVVGDARVQALFDPDPPRTSGNTVWIRATSSAGAPLGPVAVEAIMPAMGAMPEMRAKADVTAVGDAWRARFDLPMGGGWTLRITAGDATADFGFTVGSPGLVVDGSGAEAAPEVDLPDVVLSDAALSALRAAVRLSDTARDRLAHDRTDGLDTLGEEIATRLEAASDPTLGPWLVHGAAAARALAAAADLATARAAYGELMRALVAVASADARLTADLHVFSCPMRTEGFGKWVQTDPTLDNPYQGGAMPGCGVETSWTSEGPVPGDADGAVRIDAARRQQFGIRTSPVERRDLTVDVRALGRVAWDETTLVDVALTTGGWIRELRVDETGQRVSRGDVLFTLYSPDLFIAEQEWLLALQRGADDPLAKAGRKKLELLGLTSRQIDQLAARGEASTEAPILSPVTGYVVEKNVVDGGAFTAGERVYRIAPLSRVWVEAEVYSTDVAHVAAGQDATVTLPDLPGASFDATVDLLSPRVGMEEHTRSVRLSLDNPDERLLPGMYAEVRFHVALGERVVVPDSAVIYAGRRRIVFLDEGDGRLVPREITVGTRGEGLVEVLSGVTAGQEVVSSGTFLVAAESRLRAATALWEDGDAR